MCGKQIVVFDNKLYIVKLTQESAVAITDAIFLRAIFSSAAFVVCLAFWIMKQN